MGAVNGRKADGGQLRVQQGDEVWVGTAYAFAANCVLNGLVAEGLHTAYGLYHVGLEPLRPGLLLQDARGLPRSGRDAAGTTPTPKYGDKLFRAMKYMRPGAVWALYEALLKNRS